MPRPRPSLGEEGGNARAGGAHALGEGAHRHELDLDLAVQELLLERVVLSHVRRDHLCDLPCLEEQPEPALARAHVGADDGESTASAVAQRSYQVLRHAGEAKAAHQQCGAGRHVGNRLARRADDLAAQGSLRPRV